MQDPVRTPSGHVFDREALIDAIEHTGRDPIDGSTLRIEDVVPAADLAEKLRVYHFQRLMGVRRL